MSDTLILLLGNSLDEPIRWAALSGDKIIASDCAPASDVLATIAERAASSDLVAALLPGESVAMRTLPAPPKSLAKFRAAAEFLMEDELAEGVDALHIATARNEEGAGIALGVKKSLMEFWRDAFADAGLAPDMMTADFAAIHSGAGKAHLVIEASRLIASIDGKGFAAERPMADAFAATLVADENVASIVAYGDAMIDGAFARGQVVDWRNSDETALYALYARGLGGKGTPNLLQGEFRKQRDWRAAAGVWRRTGMLAAACLVAAFGVSIADASRSLRAASLFEDHAREIHVETFPGAAAQDPVDHARRMLAVPSAGVSFTGLSSIVADSLDEADGVVVDRIQFNGERNSYTLNLRFGEIDAMEKLKSTLSEKGITANETSGVRRSGSFYLGELQVGA